MVFNGLQMASDGIPWYSMTLNGIGWYSMVLNCIQWYSKVFMGRIVNVRIAHLRIVLRWAILSPSVIRLAHPKHSIAFNVIPWHWRFSMVFYGILWYSIVLNGIQ